MLLIIENDILSETSGILCHQVNCFKMGKGLAKDIIDKYPIVKTEYNKIINQYNNDKKSLLGNVLYIFVNDHITVANLFGQYNYGNDGVLYTDYQKLEECFKDVESYARKINKNVLIPYGIGCGLGGGEWKYVFHLLEKIFHDSSVTCYINKKLEE